LAFTSFLCSPPSLTPSSYTLSFSLLQSRMVGTTVPDRILLTLTTGFADLPTPKGDGLLVSLFPPDAPPPPPAPPGATQNPRRWLLYFSFVFFDPEDCHPVGTLSPNPPIRSPERSSPLTHRQDATSPSHLPPPAWLLYSIPSHSVGLHYLFTRVTRPYPSLGV